MYDTLNFYNNLLDKNIRNMHTCLLGKVKSFNPTEMNVTVAPMNPYRVHGGDVKLPELIDIPVNSINSSEFIVVTPYKEGDIVVILFAERDISDIVEEGEFSDKTNKRKFDFNDAIIIGSIKPFTEELSNANKDDLQILKKDGTSKIVLKSNGDIIIESDNVLLGGEDANESVPLGDSLKTWLDSHTHDYSWTSDSGSGTTSSPSSSPDPSSNVKVK
jgi:hypothetical protein